MSNADRLHLAIEARVVNNSRWLVLDLAEVSTAPGSTSFTLGRRLQARSHSLGVVISPGPAEATLRYAGVLDEFGIKPTLADALAGLPSGP